MRFSQIDAILCFDWKWIGDSSLIFGVTATIRTTRASPLL